METPEAKAIWQPNTFSTQFRWGDDKLERKVWQYRRKAVLKYLAFLTTNGV